MLTGLANLQKKKPTERWHKPVILDYLSQNNRAKIIENISVSNTAMKLKLGEHVIAYEMHQMVYILMLLWQHTQFQIAIM